MKVGMTSKYILGIVGIVALVGIVVLIMNSMSNSYDISGQVVGVASCGDGTCVPPENARTCPADCTAASRCGDGTCTAPETSRSCPSDCAATPTCGDGVCTSPETSRSCPRDCVDGDRDGVLDAVDACPGYDDRVDADADTVPDGCDVCAGYDDRADADGDGVPDGCDLPDLVSLGVNSMEINRTGRLNETFINFSIENIGNATRASSGFYNEISISYSLLDGSRQTGSGFAYASPSSFWTLYGYYVGYGSSFDTNEINHLYTTLPMNVELLTALKDGVISSIVVDYTINVDTSSYGSITESDETNNEYTGTYTLIHTSFVDSFY